MRIALLRSLLGIYFLLGCNNTIFSGTYFTCADAPVGTFFCDDYESAEPLSDRYFESSSSNFLPTDGVGTGGSRGLRAVFNVGTVNAGNVKKSFGRTPNNYIGTHATNPTEDYDEIYWRVDVRTQPGWQGGGGNKLSRATAFAASNWAQGMIAHLWSDGPSGRLSMDPASGIDLSGNLATTGYNDFPNLRWLGNKTGDLDLFSTENSGQWYCIEAHIKLNTPGNDDGIFEFWIDETLQQGSYDLNWHATWNNDPENYKINTIMLENYWNAGSPVAQERYMDNFIISTAPIGCDGSSSTTVNYVDFLEADFKLFWHNPVRAHPDVPLDFHYSVYEKDNQPLNWKLITAPSGMSISQDGEVDWTATTEDIGTHLIQLIVTREDGHFIQRDFTLTVSTTDFTFVSTTGDDDANDGSINSPYGTIEHAMRQIQDGDGKTIYVRDGTYQETYNWEANGIISPTRGKNFSVEDPVELRSYPNENMILDCTFSGHGFWAYNTSYWVFSNLEVINAGAGERAGLLLGGHHNIAKDFTVRDSQWQFQNNVTGILTRGRQNLVDRAFAYDNKDPNSDHWNSSNYLIYASGGANSDFVYIMNSHSTGSVTGFKVKHAGPKRIIFHNNLSHDDFYGFGMASNFSSIRHSVAINSKSDGIRLAITDPTTGGLNFTDGRMLIEQNTIVNPLNDGIFNPQGTYLEEGSIVKHNIIYSDTVDTRFLILVRPSVSISNNLFYALDQNDIVRIGGETWQPGTNYNLPAWQLESADAVWGNPQFRNLNNNNVNVPLNSPANFGDGEYAGAFRPSANDMLFRNSFE